MNSTPIVAIDVGSGYVKVVTHTGSRFSFPAFVAVKPESMINEFGGDKREGVLEYKGRQWVTGQQASIDLSAHLEDTRRDDWAGSPGWVALLLRGLAEAGIRAGQVRLVVGLPQKTWAVPLRDQLIKLLVGRHYAKFEGVSLDIEILASDSMVLPQAFSGVSWVIDNDSQAREIALAGGMVAGIDPGTYTTGFVVFEGLNYSRTLSDGVHDVGIWQVARKLQTLLDEKKGYRASVDKVMTLIRNPTKQFIGGGMVDISDLLAQAVSMVTPALIDRLKASWSNPTAMDITLYGGGAALFLPDIQRHYPQARLIDVAGGDVSQFIPAMGMLSYFATRNNLV
jgi:hypothetical protein